MAESALRQDRQDKSRLPIGVFDSGIGGLTVLSALVDRLPGESVIYLGDTARLPYGTKSAETVARYAVQAAKLLVARGVKMLVVACNTASAQALPALQAAFPGLPVVGVIEPGAAAAVATTRTGRIAVLATESTVKAGAYVRAIGKLRPDTVVTQQPCPLFVALAEEGWTEGEVPEAVARRYLGPLLADRRARPDTFVLGCTHFPTLAPAIRKVAGPDVTLVDSASTVAERVACELEQHGLGAPDTAPSLRFLATDAPDRFARVARHFLSITLRAEDVELVDLPAPTA